MQALYAPPSTIQIVSTNVGLTQLLGTYGPSQRPVYSAIRKTSIPATEIYMGYHGLQGDQQTDGRIVGEDSHPVHGGPDKAVYVFPLAHLQAWNGDDGPLLSPGAFGENITVAHLVESDVRIGDEWQWGNTTLVVTKPRRPCYKLDMLRGPGTAAQMIDSGRCGWYMRVTGRPGLVPTRGQIKVVKRATNNPTIAQAFRDKMIRDPSIPDLED